MSDPAGLSWPAVLRALSESRSLSADQTAWVMDEVMSGNASDARLAAFAVLIRAKGETPEEFTGMVRAVLRHAAPLEVSRDAVDVVGTGGDRTNTVNISTMAALVVAGSGRRVIKHGNRSASSMCGTADVLEELGVVIDLPPAGVARTVEEVGIGFCFARTFHPGFRYAGPVRSELGIPTAFNFLGPLSNPARVRAAAVGCADRSMAPVVAAVLAERGDSALVFRGDDGLDELTTTTTSSVWVASGGTVRAESVDPAALGITPVELGALRGGDRAVNAAVVRDVLAGGGRGGPRDAVLLNAAAAIAAHDGLDGALPDLLARGLEIATEAVDSGAAENLLARWVGASQDARILGA